jgi:hypothetical protein
MTFDSISQINGIGTMEEQYDLAGQVIGLAMKVHRTLGHGFLERKTRSLRENNNQVASA